MKGPSRDAIAAAIEQRRCTNEHLARRAARKCEQDNLLRIDSILYQIGDAIDEGARLPCSRSRDHESRSAWGCCSSMLLLVQLTGIVDRKPLFERVFIRFKNESASQFTTNV